MKIRVKGYEDQRQHEDAPASTKILSSSHSAKEHTVKGSGKANKRGEATQLKLHEAPHLSDSHLEGTIPGFSPSFKKIYYGELATNNQSHPVGNRTPRIPIIVPADKNATNDATPSLQNAGSSMKNNNDGISNDCFIFSMNKCSLDEKSRIMEATKGFEHQTFLETKITGNADEICQTQQALKKRRMDQATDVGGTSKVEIETVEVEEGNKPVGLVKVQHMFNKFISEDDILILDVLQSLLIAPDKMSKLKINIPSGTLGKSESSLFDRNDGHSPADLSKQEKPIDECSASRAKKKRHTKLLDAEVPAEELNVAHAIDVNKDSLNSKSTSTEISRKYFR